MNPARCLAIAISIILLFCIPGLTQQPTPAPAPPAAGPAEPSVQAGVAAVVNGQPISEAAVQRALKRVPAARQAEVRPEIVNFLIDTALIDQYLTQRVVVEEKEVDAKMQQVREAIKKQGSTLEKTLGELLLTESELRAQITAQIRWDKYAAQQATEPALRAIFDANKEMFDGSMVRARHILLTPPTGDARANQQAKDKLDGFRKQIEADAARGLAQLPPTADAAAREQTRAKLVDASFAALARKESACPSRVQDGDLGWFARTGGMVEPFAKAAFALRPFEVSGVVTTQFGHHLILTTDRRPGKETKFEDVKEDVKEVQGERLRETLLATLRPTAQITISPVKK